MSEEAATTPNAATFASSKSRTKTITLDWPVSFNGTEYKKIVLTRLTAGEVGKFQEELEALLRHDPGAAVRFPLFKDENGEPIPSEVMEALDDDDKYEIDRAALDFLPRRFREIAVNDTAPAGGENTGPTSAA